MIVPAGTLFFCLGMDLCSAVEVAPVKGLSFRLLDRGARRLYSFSFGTSALPERRCVSALKLGEVFDAEDLTDARQCCRLHRG